MKLSRKRVDSPQSGVSLVMVGLSVSVLATLSVSMIVATRATSDEKSAQREEVAALFAAEAGLSEAVFALNAGTLNTQSQGGGGTVTLGTQQTPFKMNESSYWVTVQDLPNGMKSLTSTGVDNQAGMRIELTVKQDQNNMWAWGAFGDEELTMDSNSGVDSYDSTLGTYGLQQVNGSGSKSYASNDGHVGSNGDIDLSQNSWVQGDATAGPTATTTVTGNAFVTGSTTPNSGVIALPKLQVPPIPSGGNYNFTKTTPITLPPGDHGFSDVVIQGQAILTIMGPARVVMDNLELRSNSQIEVDATGGPVEIYVNNDFIMNSNTLIASTTFMPADISINLDSDNIINPTQNVQLATVTFQSNSAIYGTIFAPRAQIDIDSNFELFGSVVARQVHLDSDAKIHFDEDLLNVNSSNTSTAWKAVCWRKLAFQP